MPDRRRPFRAGHYKTPSSPNNSDYGHEPRRDRYDWITLWTAILGVVIVSVSTGFAAWQAVLSRDALQNAVNQQRAWIRLEVEPLSPLMIFSDRADVMLRVKVANVGSVPALSAYVTTRLYPMPTELNLDVKSPYGPMVTCEKDARFGGPVPLGVTVFPGETVTLEPELASASRKYIQPLTDRNGMVGFVAVVCVQYQTGATQRAHRSGAIYTVADVTRPSRFDFVSGGDGVGRQNLLLERLGVGDVAD